MYLSFTMVFLHQESMQLFLSHLLNGKIVIEISHMCQSYFKNRSGNFLRPTKVWAESIYLFII